MSESFSLRLFSLVCSVGDEANIAQSCMYLNLENYALKEITMDRNNGHELIRDVRPHFHRWQSTSKTERKKL